MCSSDFLATRQAKHDPSPGIRDALHCNAKLEADALVAKCRLQLGSNLWVFTRKQLADAIDDRDLRTESTKHLSKLAADVTSTEDDQMLGDFAQLYQLVIVQPFDLVDPGQRGHRRPGPYIEDHDLCPMPLAIYL